MNKKDQFIESIKEGYAFEGENILIGAAIFNGETLTETQIKLPLKTFNRHGLIAGATGSGKTKTLQILAENLSSSGVPSLLMDIKGDLSGIAMAGQSNPKIEIRSKAIGIPFIPSGNKVEFLTISKENGTRLRATVSEFGPVLFSKILELNETQASIVSVIFKYCDDKRLSLLDLPDIKAVLQFISNEGKDEFEASYGLLSKSSIGIILRKIIELEQQGANEFFGEISFDVNDLCRIDTNGNGIISIIRLTDLQDRPKLFSTYILQMLAEIYSSYPEAGDVEKPKLVIFIDEAHLLFQEASRTLLDQIETIIKLIRSKGIGVYFITQNPTDIPSMVLSQLGLKIQHSLRAFTAKDRKNIQKTAENYPLSDFYQVDDLITQLGIGEALITALNEKGIPTPLVHAMLRAPQSRMDILTANEINQIVINSPLLYKYNQSIDRESAQEILSSKLDQASSEEHEIEMKKSTKKEEPGWFEKVLSDHTTRQIGRSVARELTRGLLGVLGLGGRRR
ncbi:MAG TPA: helicase HerA-like domain-containing protein [Saprospiraceae bacterium]|nr:helicase HerA-like domain-containing protein [Saprospiraceae bacterium]